MAVPKVRFPGFTGDWEQRKLGDIGTCQSGIGFPDAEQGGTKGTPFFKVSDMNNPGNETEMMVANNYVTDEQIARKKWKPITDVPAMFFAKVGAAVMLNRKRLVTFPFLLDNNTMAYKFGEVWDSKFGKALFETINLSSLVQVGALPSYNAGDVEEIEISMPPTKDEQVTIGTFFEQIDNTLTLHQHKLADLKALKKAMLQKMFPKEGEDVPEVRFPGFTDAWEQRKLGELFEERNEQAPMDDEYPLMAFIANIGVAPKGDRYDRSALVHDEKGKKYKRTELGDFIYSSNNLETGSIGLNNYGKACISPVYSIFKSKHCVNSDS